MINDIIIWVPFIGFEKEYMINSFGNVIGLDRTVIFKDGRKRFVKSTKRKLGKDSHGYIQICLKRGQTIPIHTAVFFSFNPTIKKRNGFEVDHIDENKENNHFDNLQYVPCRTNLTKKAFSNPKRSSLVGVDYFKRTGRWHARIYANGKSKYLGSFKTELEGHNAYIKALSLVKTESPNKKKVKL